MNFNRKLSFTIGLTTKKGEELPESTAVEVVSGYFDGFTVTENLGYWEGNPEKSLTFTVLLNAEDPIVAKAESIAEQFARACDQTCVLWCLDYVKGGLGYAG